MMVRIQKTTGEQTVVTREDAEAEMFALLNAGEWTREPVRRTGDLAVAKVWTGGGHTLERTMLDRITWEAI